MHNQKVVELNGQEFVKTIRLQDSSRKMLIQMPTDCLLGLIVNISKLRDQR